MNLVDRASKLIQQQQFKSALPVLKKLTRGSHRFWALKMSGMVYRELGQLSDASRALEKALAISPDDVDANLFMATVSHESGNGHGALPFLEEVCRCDPGNYHALRLLVLVSLDDERYQDALHYGSQISSAWPEDPEAQLLHGQALLNAGNAGEAVHYFDRVIALSSTRHEGYYCRAKALRALGYIDEAIAGYQRAIHYAGEVTGPAVELAGLYEQVRRIPEATALYRRLLARFPDNTHILNSAASHYIKLYRSQEAAALLNRSIEIDAHQVSAHATLASVYKSIGMLDRYRKSSGMAMSLAEPDPVSFSTYLLNSNYFPDITNRELFEEHKKWDRLFSTPDAQFDHAQHDRSNGRKLRIGYISADFRNHAVYYCIEPMLASHDKNGFEVFCYYNAIGKDQVTRRFEGYADVWRDIYSLTDEQVARLIYEDRIDILVDLSGHTAGNRLSVVAKKPAPVQIEYEAYPNTTGLAAIDYKLTDRWLDTEVDRQWHSEKLVSLGECFICYQPNPDAPEVSEPPVATNRHVTLGSFSNLYKINNSVVKLWSELLHRVPDSRLMFFRLSINDEAVSHFQMLFQERGIDKSRLVFVGEIPARYAALQGGTGCMAMMSECDFILDTFPYSSHTIALEALWMGVPILALYGNRHASRVCASIVSAAGHPELIARSREEYLDKAVALCKQPERIVQLRHSLRSDFRNSILMDFPSFTRRIEDVYRQVWASYCGHCTS